ncbi:MAG: nitroreductase/quinone reductase family protein [Pseudomonadales bacterium]
MNWKFFGKIHAWIYTASGGRFGANAGPLKIALVTTTGRKSGKQRSVPIASYPYKDSVAVSASNSGQSSHPAWFLNMQANPEVTVQLGTDKYSAIAEVVADEQRDELWAIATKINPHQKEYRAKTDREIPLVWFRRV